MRLDLLLEKVSCADLIDLNKATQLRCSLLESISDLVTMDDAEIGCISTSSGRSQATRFVCFCFLVAEFSRSIIRLDRSKELRSAMEAAMGVSMIVGRIGTLNF
jgi:hypothetical protein